MFLSITITDCPRFGAINCMSSRRCIVNLLLPFLRSQETLTSNFVTVPISKNQPVISCNIHQKKNNFFGCK
jgi:hypothetical protein